MSRTGGRSDQLTAFEAETRIDRQFRGTTRARQHETSAAPEAELRMRRIAPPAARALFPRSRIQTRGHWITSSARASTDGGIVKPSALAVLMLITNLNVVGCSTGRSAGLAPLRILST